MNLLWDMLFAGQNDVGLAINAFIALLFVLGCRDILRGRKAIAAERESVKTARQALGNTDMDEISEELSGSTLVRLLRISQTSLLGHRIVRIMQLRTAGLASRDVLQQLTLEQVGSYGALARQIGSTLTLVGLLGTVFGLSLALMNIGDASAGIKGVDDLEKLSRALGGTMSGMKTAFGCTLAGLISAVILSFQNHSLRRAQSLVSAEIEEFLLCELLPAISRYDAEVETASKSFAEVLVNASGRIESLTENVKRAAEEFREASGEFRTTLSVMSTAVSESATEMSAAAASNAEIKKFLVAYHEEYKTFVAGSAETFRKALLSAAENMAKQNSIELGTVLQKHLDGVEKVVRNHHDVMQTVSDMVLDVQLNGRARAASHNGGVS